MSEILDHVSYLSQTVGPRPAGTEEEQQAALYITEHFQKEAALSARIEDFNGKADTYLARALLCAVSVIVAILAMAVPVLNVFAFILSLVTAGLYVAEALDKSLIARFFPNSVSQNVVAKYEPGYSPDGNGVRRRKIVLVAHYDSGKVRNELRNPILKALGPLSWVALGAMVLVPLMLLIKTLATGEDGSSPLAINIILGIAVVVCLLPIAEAVFGKFAAYNEAANCNASGVSVLMDLASRIGKGRTSEDEMASEQVNRGADALRAAGLVPDGAELSYGVSVSGPQFAEASPSARLASAKAALAAFSGKPVAGAHYSDLSSNLVQVSQAEYEAPSAEQMHEFRDETKSFFTGSSMRSSSQAAGEVVSVEEYEALMQNESVAKVPAENQVAPEAVQAETVAPAPAAIEAPSAAEAETDSSVPAWFKAAQQKAKREPQGEKHIQRSRYADALSAVSEVSEQGLEQTSAPIQEHPEVGVENVESVEAATQQQEQIPSLAPQDEPVAGRSPVNVSALLRDELPELNVPDMNISEPAFLQLPRVEAEPAALPERQAVTVAAAQPRPQKASSFLDSLPSIGDTDASVQPASGEAANADAVAAQCFVPAVRPAAQSSDSRAALASLPALNGSETPSAAASQARPSVKSLGLSLPSLSASLPVIAKQPAGVSSFEKEEETTSSGMPIAPVSTGSAGATGSFAPVVEEIAETAASEDLYVEDADDSEYEENFTQAGASAGPGYVEMPKSRFQRLLARFRKHKDTEESSPQEWLDVEENFEARSAGAARGSWESFRDDYSDDQEATESVDFSGDFGSHESADNTDGEDFYAHDSWNTDNDFYSYSYDQDEDFGYDEEGDSKKRDWFGGAFSQEMLDAVAGAAGNDAAMMGSDKEVEQIQNFRNPGINTEVWFVALGSQLSGNEGIKAFFSEHEQDLRGAIVIELDALGAGDLALVESEGVLKQVKTSSRMSRYVKKTMKSVPITVGSLAMNWNESAASYAIKHGHQAMHLVGSDGSKPAFMGQTDDVLENINEKKLQQNADFVMNLLKNI